MNFVEMIYELKTNGGYVTNDLNWWKKSRMFYRDGELHIFALENDQIDDNGIIQVEGFDESEVETKSWIKIDVLLPVAPKDVVVELMEGKELVYADDNVIYRYNKELNVIEYDYPEFCGETSWLTCEDKLNDFIKRNYFVRP